MLSKFSFGRPMRGAVADISLNDKLISPIDDISDIRFIGDIRYGDKSMTFTLDTSGDIGPLPAGPYNERFMRWDDLSPLAQGYVEAMPWRDADGLPLGYALEQDRDGDWTLMGPLHVVLFSEPGEGLLIGTCDRATAVADALAAITEAAGFSDLAPETLARIIADCEAADAASRDFGYQSTGLEFWKVRQAGLIDAFPPLTVQLGDDGKVRFA